MWGLVKLKEKKREEINFIINFLKPAYILNEKQIP